MYIFLLSLLILDACLLIPIVLLQSGKGGGLAAMGAEPARTPSSGAARPRRSSPRPGWAGGVFLLLALLLTNMNAGAARRASILRGGAQQTAPATTSPALPGLTPAPKGQAPAPATGGTAQPAAPMKTAPAGQPAAPAPKQ